MFQRLSRVFRSFIGFFISVAENPELILEQNIRDLNDQVPRMNESIAMVKANVTLLEKEEAKYQYDINDLTAKIKASIQAGRDDQPRNGSPDVYVDAIASAAGWRSLNLDGGRLVQRGRQGRHKFPDRAATKVLPGRRGGER